MQKVYYINETKIAGSCKKLSKGKDVEKIQCWLTLWGQLNPGWGTVVKIDADFGSGTDAAVRIFQAKKGLTVNGVVDANTFKELCAPLNNAFTGSITGGDFRKLVLSAAALHLKNNPRELVIDGKSNMGPWVRAYMDGYEGTDWFWCMGFVQTILDQAATAQGKNFKTLMPLTYSCDTVGTHGLNNTIPGTTTKRLMRYSAIRTNPALVKPGDVFLLQKTPNDWFHTGIITAVNGDVFETIEGNTNEGGSHNGYAVLKRIRNFKKDKLDVFSVEGF